MSISDYEIVKVISKQYFGKMQEFMNKNKSEKKVHMAESAK